MSPGVEDGWQPSCLATVRMDHVYRKYLKSINALEKRARIKVSSAIPANKKPDRLRTEVTS